MAFLRQVIAPLLIVLVFLVALIAVSARAFLPNDMAAPAPIETVEPEAQIPSPKAVAGLPATLKALVHGLPSDPIGSSL
jgi:hypothetical protein